MPSIADAVRGLIKKVERKPLFDQAALDAMRLAEEFEAVKPEEYTIPLDALAGFRVAPSERSVSHKVR